MLSALDLINHYLGYLNVNPKLKGRIYTVLAAVGSSYILYLAYSYLSNKAYVRGSLILLAFIGILYFTAVNFFYYFTDKAPKWDVSPKIAKVLGTPQEAADEAVPAGGVQFVPSNGLYASNEVLPATLKLDPGMEAELATIASQITQSHLADNNYDGLSENQQMNLLSQGQTKVYATGDGAPLPYYRLEQDTDGLAIYGAINEMSAKRLGVVTEVGLQPIADAAKKYNLYVATAVIKGGLAHVKGRAGLTEIQDPYELHVELAYKPK